MENTALIEYRNNSTAFASFLRKGNVVKYTRFTNEDIVDFLPQIDALFVSSPIAMTLYRGIDTKYSVFNKPVSSIKEGDVIKDLSYCSTSTSKEVALEFSYNDSPIFVIKTKIGAKMIDMEGIGGTYHDYQSEYLLPRGSRFKVLHVSQQEIIVELL